MARKKVLSAASAKALERMSFPRFNQRPINYFRDLISDQTQTGKPAHDDTELRSKLEQEFAEEKRRLIEQSDTMAGAQYHQGYESGKAQASQELVQAIKLLSQYSQLLISEREELAARYEKQAVDLAFVIAKQIIGSEITIRPDSVATLVEHAVRQIVEAKAVVLRVHSADLEEIRSAAEVWKSHAGMPANFELRADSTLSRGDCIVESDSGMIDARVQSQIERMREHLIAGGQS